MGSQWTFQRCDQEDPHPTILTKIKEGMLAEVDVEMVPVVNWLNSIPGIETFACCQGSEIEYCGEPYVSFTCRSMKSLEVVLLKLESPCNWA